MKEKKEKCFTLMIIPHQAGPKPLSLKIPHFWVYSTAAVLLFLFLFFLSSLVYSLHLSRRMVNYLNTLAKNREQKEVISSFSLKTESIHQALLELAQSDLELRKILGLKDWKSKIKLSLKKESTQEQSDTSPPDLLVATQKIEERKASLQELRNWVDHLRQRFAATPSLWPIRGRVVSWFGYRVYPWRGFHAGIDISASYAEAVRSTAAGWVTDVGWRQGYGKVVEVDHGWGISTLYGHNSAYAVRVGQRVKKGSVVSYVGTTGYTTGPHLHYEVKRWGKAVNPLAYLDLNLFTASRVLR